MANLQQGERCFAASDKRQNASRSGNLDALASETAKKDAMKNHLRIEAIKASALQSVGGLVPLPRVQGNMQEAELSPSPAVASPTNVSPLNGHHERTLADYARQTTDPASDSYWQQRGFRNRPPNWKDIYETEMGPVH
eukprot:GILK01007549.1.p1 GENE.GILK01007549.1~~GILK01007549.1.p1  ORF type:complete len:138 (+),score=24.08 GILK01007549.1:88-501(+)